MRLRTTLITNVDGNKSYVYDTSDNLIFTTHDVAMSHALLRSLRAAPDMEYQRRWVEKRADEMMREWGYTEE